MEIHSHTRAHLISDNFLTLRNMHAKADQRLWWVLDWSDKLACICIVSVFPGGSQIAWSHLPTRSMFSVFVAMCCCVCRYTLVCVCSLTCTGGWMHASLSGVLGEEMPRWRRVWPWPPVPDIHLTRCLSCRYTHGWLINPESLQLQGEEEGEGGREGGRVSRRVDEWWYGWVLSQFVRSNRNK